MPICWLKPFDPRCPTLPSSGPPLGRHSSVRPNARTWLLALVSAGCSLAQPALVRAQSGSIVGTVSDSATHAPVPAAQIQLVGTTRGTLSGEDGRFTVSAVTAGPIQIRVTRIGYGAKVRTVMVPANGADTVAIAMAATSVTLDQVVVTATGETERERQTGNTVNLISSDSVPKAAVSTFSELITGQAPGVDVQPPAGEIGAGSRIRIRGSNSISLDNSPLLVIDGVYVDNNPQAILAPSDTSRSPAGEPESNREEHRQHHKRSDATL